MRLLLVEDHVPLADELLAALGRQGYAVDWLTVVTRFIKAQPSPTTSLFWIWACPACPGLRFSSNGAARAWLPPY